MADNRSPEAKRLAEAGQTVRKGVGEIREALLQLLPPSYQEHRRLARRERLLAWRSAIDARITALDGRIKASAGAKR